MPRSPSSSKSCRQTTSWRSRSCKRKRRQCKPVRMREKSVRSPTPPTAKVLRLSRWPVGEVRGFMKYQRGYVPKEPVAERLKHYNEFLKVLSTEELRTQGARCMD